jgi:RNA polymerase sigma factor (sigma-70 family)
LDFHVHKKLGFDGYFEQQELVRRHSSVPSSVRLMNSSDSLYRQIIEPIEDRMIRSVWRITRNAQDAEDAMQNALMAIWKRQHHISKHSSPQALILRMCIDAACDVARRRGRDRRKIEPHDPVDQLVDGAQLPWEEIARRELSSEIVTAITRLSRCQAAAITLRVFEELPYEQIAAAMNCTAATARKHAERARAHLRVVLAKHEPNRMPGRS